jgi:GNAT superfamily N-acetyltransferase
VPEIRPFRRSDREQLTALVNSTGEDFFTVGSVSVNTVLSQLEREPDEWIVDPWVVERQTLVAIERDTVVAAAHLLRYGDDEPVTESYRGLGEIRWIVARPEANDPADRLLAGCLAVFAGWGVARRAADCSLPAPFTYGIAENWPHLRDLLVRNGFVQRGQVELVLHVRVAALPAPHEPPLAGLDLRRSVGSVGTRLAAILDGEEIGTIEVERLTGGGRNPTVVAWADVGNLGVRAEHRRRGVATWLLGHARAWLELGEVERLAAYAIVGKREEELAFYRAAGFEQLTRIERGWSLPENDEGRPESRPSH